MKILKKINVLKNALIFFLIFLSSCTNGPIVTNIVKGIYTSERANKEEVSVITILSGDTLLSIAKKYNLTKKELIKLNKIKKPYILKPGKKLKIPKPKKYKISKGDTLFKISKCYSIMIKEIKEKNDKISERKLRVGDIIFLPYYASNSCISKLKKQKAKRTIKKDIPSKELFVWPTEGKLLTKFGKQKGGRRNDSINIISAKGNPVRASLSGQVIYRGNELPAWGNLILIKHKNNWTTAYAHLDKFLVKKGEFVKTGDIIGSVGSTGNVENFQLHFQTRKYSKPVNPIKFLKKK